MSARFRFADRDAAGHALAELLGRYANRTDVVVLGLPRGGIAVAAAVAEALDAPLDVVVVRKLGAPGHAELAMGALALWGGSVEVIRNEDVLCQLAISEELFAATRAREQRVAELRAAEWGQHPPRLDHRAVVLVDDGLATGATLRAAVKVLRAAGARHLVAALPVAPAGELERIAGLVEDLACPLVPERFGAVASHYVDFSQVEDATVRDILARAARRVG